MSRTLKLAAVAAAAATLAGCLSPELTQRTLGEYQNAANKADTKRAEINRAIDANRAYVEQAQEVNRPYLVGKSVPLARDVRLPRALQRGFKTAVLFPTGRVSLAEAAQRIGLVTGITVSITPDVYLSALSLMPKSGTMDTGAAKVGALGSQPIPPVPLPSPTGLPPTVGSGLPPAPLPLPTLSGGAGIVQPDSPTDLDFPRMEAPLAQILDNIASRRQIQWKYDDQANAIKFYRLVTKSWNLPVSPATNSYSTALSGPTYQSNNSNALTTQQAANAVRSEASGLNELTSIKEAADSVLTGWARSMPTRPPAPSRSPIRRTRWSVLTRSSRNRSRFCPAWSCCASRRCRSPPPTPGRAGLTGMPC